VKLAIFETTRQVLQLYFLMHYIPSIYIYVQKVSLNFEKEKNLTHERQKIGEVLQKLGAFTFKKFTILSYLLSNS